MKLAKQLLSIVVLLGGCVVVPLYAPPDSTGNSVINFSDSTVTSFYFHENGSNCTDTRRLSEAHDPLRNRTGDLVLSANKRVAFTLLWGRFTPTGIAGCSIILSFEPQPNNRYQVVGSFDGQMCRAGIVNAEHLANPNADRGSVMEMKQVISTGALLVGQRASTCEPVRKSM
jgi:hypothetical protein